MPTPFPAMTVRSTWTSVPETWTAMPVAPPDTLPENVESLIVARLPKAITAPKELLVATTLLRLALMRGQVPHPTTMPAWLLSDRLVFETVSTPLAVDRISLMPRPSAKPPLWNPNISLSWMMTVLAERILTPLFEAEPVWPPEPLMERFFRVTREFVSAGSVMLMMTPHVPVASMLPNP